LLALAIRNLSRGRLSACQYALARPIRSRSKPPGFILPCQPALADRPPSGNGPSAVLKPEQRNLARVNVRSALQRVVSQPRPGWWGTSRNRAAQAIAGPSPLEP